MKIRTRMFIAFLLVAGVGFYQLVDWIREDLRPRYLETMEESMVDTATLLASLISEKSQRDGIHTDDLRLAFDHAQKRRFSAQIFEMTKTKVNMRVYVTDRNGIVLFDSNHGNDEGKDYSRWNDVIRTLRGEYGARATRLIPEDPRTSIVHVASPIIIDGEIAGVLTICKPSGSLTLFMEAAQHKVAVAGIIAAISVILLGSVISAWITWPIEKLTHYATSIRDGKRAALPKLGRGEIAALGAAFEEMRAALEGKQYVEEYVQTLTHEMKSPLSAIRGAIELLEEDMPLEQRRQFLANLKSESERIQGLVDRMLQLSALENRRELRDVEEVSIAEMVGDVIASMQPVLSSREIQVSVNQVPGVTVRAERFLLRQALANLLQNAVEFSPRGAEIRILAERQEGKVILRIQDYGPGIPDYALEKVFDRFYSLRRPDTGKKSSGLGLVFVREVASLHGGEVRLINRPEGGAEAILTLPAKAQ